MMKNHLRINNIVNFDSYYIYNNKKEEKNEEISFKCIIITVIKVSIKYQSIFYFLIYDAYVSFKRF